MRLRQRQLNTQSGSRNVNPSELASCKSGCQHLSGLNASPAHIVPQLSLEHLAIRASSVRVAAANALEREPIAQLHSLLLSALSDRSPLVRLHVGFALIANVRTKLDNEAVRLHLTNARSSQRLVLLGAQFMRRHRDALGDLLRWVSNSKSYYEVVVGARTVIAIRKCLSSQDRRQAALTFRNLRTTFNLRSVDDAVGEMLISLKEHGAERKSTYINASQNQIMFATPVDSRYLAFCVSA